MYMVIRMQHLRSAGRITYDEIYSGAVYTLYIYSKNFKL